MGKVEWRKPYKISELIEIVTKDYWVLNEPDIHGKHLCPDTGIFDLQLYIRKFEEEIYEDLVCYLEDYPEITDDDEEVFPEFVAEEGLVLLYSGENFEAVISGAFDQKLNPSMKEFIDSLNYYRDNDSYLDLE